jgi:hypothetical protein
MRSIAIQQMETIRIFRGDMRTPGKACRKAKPDVILGVFVLKHDNVADITQRFCARKRRYAPKEKRTGNHFPWEKNPR